MSELRWFREDRVVSALKTALDHAVEQGGQEAKSVAWDVWGNFIREIEPFAAANPPAPPHTEGD
jgi:hypothetical protein